MKKILLLCLVTLFTGILSAQNANEQDVVYLNNGNVIKGAIIEFKPNVSLRIRTADGTEYSYPMVEVRTLSRGNVIVPNDPGNSKYVHYSEAERGYWIAAEVSGGMSLDSGPHVGYTQLSMVNGYRLSDYFKFGLGLGVRYYLENENQRIKRSAWAYPIYLDLRGNFTSQKIHRIAPFWSMDIGTTICDGFFVSPTLGVKFGGQRSNLTLGVGYLGQNVRTLKLTKDYDIVKSTKMLNILSVKVGYEF